MNKTGVDDTGSVELGVTLDSDVEGGALIERSKTPKEPLDANDVYFEPSPFTGLKPA